MPDEAPTATADTTEAAAIERDEHLVSGVGRRLVLWAAGTTLIALVILGIALYAAVDQSLTSTGVHQLDDRATALRHLIEGPTGTPPDGDDLPTGFRFGGGASGTVALILDANGRQIRPRNAAPTVISPDTASFNAARQSGQDVRLAVVDETPVRILTTTAESRVGTIYLQIFQDRTAEARTLGVLLVALLGGGVAVLLAAAGVGVVYSRRALVPIRSSLVSQRQALRRQREFAADASHELRTPLTVVRVSLDHLRRHPDAPVSQVGSALDDIGAEVESLTRLVEDLLLLARSDSGAVTLERTPIDLGDVAADGAATLAGTAATRDVSVTIDPEPATVMGDAGRLRQLVLILVDNAIAHSPRGASVRVAVRLEGPSATLTVEDEGSGIRDSELPRVFERFWRAAGAPSGGSGLGLSIADWIVSTHGGTITAGNREAGGARFVVRLPAQGGPRPE
ncbi:MAG: HAMP domain-containing sensor histidine kinase [Chloroflexota bacterium]